MASNAAATNMEELSTEVKEPEAEAKSAVGDVEEEGIGPLPMLSIDDVEEILKAPVPYADDEQKLICQQLVEELSREDQEVAARTSYAYWVAATTHEKTSTEEIRLRMSMRDARRHLVGENGNYKKALKRFREAIELRKEGYFDVLRMCFPRVDISIFKDEEITPKVQEKIELYRSHILDDLSKQIMVVRGQDNDGRAILIKMPRYAPPSTVGGEAFISVQMYMAERAFATTEYLSKGREEKIILIFNFTDYASGNAPAVATMKEFITKSQLMFPERVRAVIIIDPPFWLRAIFSVVRPFLSNDTRKKLQMVYGSKKDEVIRNFFNEKNAMPFMLPDGELSSAICLQKYLNNVQFHCKYDDVYETET